MATETVTHPAMVKGFQQGQPKGHLQEQTAEKQEEGRPRGGGGGHAKVY